MTAAGLVTPFTPAAADDFDDFISSASADFDQFIDEANQNFINFLRSPWKEIKAEPPKQLRKSPELPAPVIFNPDSIASAPLAIAAPRVDDNRREEPKAGVEPENQPNENSGDIVAKEKSENGGDKSQTDEDKVRELLAQNSGKPGSSVVTKPRKVEEIAPKPSTPSASSKPVAPATPATPKPGQAKPATPATPATPETPATPSKAATPSKPATPVAPSKPTAPSAPKSEAQPRQSEPLYVGGEGRTPIEFCGVTYYVDSSLKKAIKLSRLDENSIADAHEKLFKKNYNPILNDLKTLRSKDLGSDWALVMFVKKIGETFGGANESVVIRQFLLNQLGLKTRIARKVSPQSLALYVATDVELFQHPYIERGGIKYYDTDSKQLYRFTMCEADAPAAKSPVAMSVSKSPKMSGERESSAKKSSRYGTEVSVTLPKRLIEFYGGIPQCDYKIYAGANVDKEFSDALLGSLRGAIAGKTKSQAANLLLDFVQNGFAYATDEEQFGYEKPFFIEELFHYPACDCEDRSMLYRYLVKNLLGLDCILINYPNHIATAVNFGDEAVSGDAVTYKGKPYVICDPTYINASIGMAMPSYKSTPPTVVAL